MEVETFETFKKYRVQKKLFSLFRADSLDWKMLAEEFRDKTEGLF